MKPAKRFHKPRRPSRALVSAVLCAAADDAVETHRRASLPLVVWEDGKVTLVSVDEVAAQRPRSKPRRRKPPGKTSKK